jgi:hypothetical protein
MNTVPAVISPPASIESYFKRPPLLSTESRREYEAMFRALAARLKPQDEFEWVLVYDYLHCSWQIRRWRKAAAALIETIRQDALRAVLESILESDDKDGRQLIDGYVDNWFKEDEGATKSAFEVLARRGLNEDHITAQAMAMRLPELDRAEGMIGDFERRRTAVLREFEYYRIAASWRAPGGLPALLDAAAGAKPAVTTGEAA